MLLLLTNDDGIDAPGIHALRQAVQKLGKKALIVAPQQHLSGCSHQVTTNQPIQIQQRSEQEYAIAGTPADCVRIALSHLNAQPAFVLSGINAGGNLGADIYISGTVAAVREACLHRVPGVAISHYRQGKRPIDWELASDLTAQVLTALWEQPIASDRFWNVNLPHLVPGVTQANMVYCPPCTQPLPAVYRAEGDTLYYAGEYNQRSREPGADVDVCFSGQIAISTIQLAS